MPDTIQFICPECGETMGLRRDLLGELCRCPACGGNVETPSEAVVAAMEGMGADSTDSRTDATPPELEGTETAAERAVLVLTDGRYIGMGFVMPLLIGGYCLIFGVIRRHMLIGGYEGPSAMWGTWQDILTGHEALAVGVMGVLLSIGFHVAAIWQPIFQSRALSFLSGLLMMGGVAGFIYIYLSAALS